MGDRLRPVETRHSAGQASRSIREKKTTGLQRVWGPIGTQLRLHQADGGTAMTIEPRPRRSPPRMNLSGREWKLYLVGGLGLAYAASLSAIATQIRPVATQQSASSNPDARVAPPIASSGTAPVWLAQLPIAERPSLALRLAGRWSILPHRRSVQAEHRPRPNLQPHCPRPTPELIQCRHRPKPPLGRHEF
jgi:hypothetical protein